MLLCRIFILFLFFSLPVYSGVKFEVVPSTDKIHIGDTFTLTLHASYSKDIRVNLANPEFSPFEIVDNYIEKSDGDMKWFFILSAYNIGKLDIPAEKLDYEDSFSKGVLLSETITIDVVALLPDSADANNLHPLKDLFSFRKTISPKKAFILLLILIIIISIVYTAYRYWKKINADKPISLFNKEKPPHIRALETIDWIEGENFPSRGMIQEHYFQLTSVLKLYLNELTNNNILESTTAEIKEIFEKERYFTLKSRERLYDYFERADMAKFAKWKPDNDEIHRSLSAARSLINDLNTGIKEDDICPKTAEV